MKFNYKKIANYIKLFILAISAVFVLSSCNVKTVKYNNNSAVNTETSISSNVNNAKNISSDKQHTDTNKSAIDEDGTYTSKEDVALYIYTYHKLPQNFITKNEAKKLGWNNSKNYVGDVAKGKSIGGDRYSNYEKRLPDIKGRKYVECDIDYKGKKRNAKRIIYADDFDETIGFIYYTEDHYKTFKKLY